MYTTTELTFIIAIIILCLLIDMTSLCYAERVKILSNRLLIYMGIS